jgi:adenylate kinase
MLVVSKTFDKIWDFALNEDIVTTMANEFHSWIDKDGKRRINRYHKEDSLLLHTYMVMQEIQNYLKTKGVKNERLVEELLLIGLLHDIGKTFCYSFRETKRGIVKNYNGHDYAGALYSIGLLKKYFKNESSNIERLRELIVPILYHQQAHKHPISIFNRSNPNYKHLSLKEKFYLKILQHADDNGRISELRNEVDLVIYKALLAEYYLYREKSEKYDKELHVFFGLPGTGKTTYRYKLIEKYGKENVGVISHDDIIEEWAKEHNLTYPQAFKLIPTEYREAKFNEAIKAAKNKDIIIIDMTNLTKRARRKWFNMFGKRKRIVHIFLRDYQGILNDRTEKVGIDNIKDMLSATTVPSIIEELIDEVNIHLF